MPIPRVSAVIPHWPLDDEVDQALRLCLAALPAECEKIVSVNQGTGFAVNVNIGVRVAGGDYLAVVTNDSELIDAWLAANERRFQEKWGWVPPPPDAPESHE